VCACQSSWSCGLVSSSSGAAAQKRARRAAFWQSNTMSSSLITPTDCRSWRAAAVPDRSHDGCAAHPSDELVERTEFSIFPFGRITQRGFRAREVEQVGAETHDLLGRPKLAAAQPACGRCIAAHVTQRAPRTACRQSATNGNHTIPPSWVSPTWLTAHDTTRRPPSSRAPRCSAATTVLRWPPRPPRPQPAAAG